MSGPARTVEGRIDFKHMLFKTKRFHHVFVSKLDH